ncbi:MAG: FG-GAP repeat protein [Nannocystaceae bacterium]
MDFASLMMYGSNSQCKPDDGCSNQCLNAVEGMCPDSICGKPNDIYNADKDATDPNLYYIRTKNWVEGEDDFGKGMSTKIDKGSLGLSYNDQDALRLYGGHEFVQTFVEGVSPWFPDNGDGIPKLKYKGIEEGDRFGAALALGQFGDEDHGLIVGMPGETEDVLGVASGAATVWEASMNTEVLPVGEADGNAHLPAFPTHLPDQFMVPESFDDSIYQADHGDRFGAAVAAVDFDGDGIDEIAVGAPYAGLDGRGAVYVYRTGNSKANHKPWKIIHSDMPIDPSTPGSFGTALAAGMFSDCSGSREGLAVGIPDGETQGDPGMVHIYRYVGGQFKRVEKLVPTDLGFAGIPQRFGAALAAADFDGDGQDGLVVGAPNYSVSESFRDLGRVVFYEHSSPGCSVKLQFEADDKGWIYFARLGTSIVAGNFLTGSAPDASYDDVAVGAPGGNNGVTGSVRTYRGGAGGITFHEEIRQDSHNLDLNESEDEFGHALALVEYRETGTLAERPAHLFVGAPGETTNGFQNGAVYDLFFDDLNALKGQTFLGGTRQTSPCDAGLTWGCNSINTDDQSMAQRFGETIAADDQVLAIGDPGYVYNFALPEAGAARIYIRERDQEKSDSWHLMRWIAEYASWPNTAEILLP